MFVIIRHYKTVKHHHKENIIYDKTFDKSKPYVKMIIKLCDKSKFNKITFVCSPQDRTIMTSLILSSALKSYFIKKKISHIEIVDPIIDEKINRDPRKTKTFTDYEKVINKYDHGPNSKSLIIFITHSSVIHSLYKSILYHYTQVHDQTKSTHIKTWSLSYAMVTNDKFYHKFNIDMS